MLTTNPAKIEEWQKAKGNGPWIVLRLAPARSNDDSDLRLAEIIYRPFIGGQIKRSSIKPELWNQYNGCRAIAIFFLLAAAKRSCSFDPGEDVMIVETPVRPSWPNSFSELIQEKKFENSVWLQKLFGLEKSTATGLPFDNGLALIAKKTGRSLKSHNNQGDLNRSKFPKIKLFLKTSVLLPKKVFILKGLYADPPNEGLTVPEELARLAMVLESGDKGWRKILREYSTEAPKPPPTGTEMASPTNEYESAKTQKIQKESLPEQFRMQSVPWIKSYIIAALASNRGDAVVKNSLNELLEPESINVIAEKLATESMDSFCDFYCGFYDDLGTIKKNVAHALTANSDFRKKLARMVAHSGYRDILGWFAVFSLNCTREMILEVEHELIAAEKEPTFKDKFSLFSERLTPLIERFSAYGCVVAARIFERIAEEGKSAVESQQVVSNKRLKKK